MIYMTPGVPINLQWGAFKSNGDTVNNLLQVAIHYTSQPNL